MQTLRRKLARRSNRDPSLIPVAPVALRAAVTALLLSQGLPLAAQELSLLGSPARAQESSGSSRDELLIAEVELNGLTKGELTVVRRRDGDFLLTGDDLRNMGVQPPYGTPEVMEGIDFFSLRSVGATRLAFDEGKVRLRAVLAPEKMAQQTLDLRPGRPEPVTESRDDSGFFNYRVLNYGDDQGAQSWSLNTEAGVRWRELFFHSETAHVRDDHTQEDLRYRTSVTYDNRHTLQRLVVGDVVASSGELGRVVNLGGISFSKSYAINPYFVRQPMADLAGVLQAPSEVSVYLDGAPVRTETLAPGQFELKDLHYYGGRHDVELVIRDGVGDEQHFLYPYYFSDQNLGEGLHDYSYNVGLLRPSLTSDVYEDWAFSAFHRYGLSDTWTVGARGEGQARRFNVGPTATLRSDRFGIFAGGASLSEGDEGTGDAKSVAYAFQSRAFSMQAAARFFSAHYETLGRLPGASRPREDWTVGAGLPARGIGHLSVGYRSLVKYAGDNQKSVSVGLSRPLGSGLHLLATVSRIHEPAAETNIYLALSYHAPNDIHTHWLHERDHEVTRDSMQVGNTMPMGEGVGYRVVADRVQSAAGLGASVAPEIQFYGRHGIYAARLRAESAPDGTRRVAYQWSIGGGIAYVGDNIAFSRPITDSFGMVEIPDLADIRVYQSGREVGRTDANGRLFLPNLGSYRVNRISIDDRDMPLDYTMRRKDAEIMPPLRSGSRVRFEATRLQSVMGRLRVKSSGDWQAVHYGELIVALAGTSVTVPVGREGEFYLEDVKPARYAARLESGGQRCDFFLTVEEPTDTLTDLGVLDVCEIAP